MESACGIGREYSFVRSCGLETNLAKLEAFGFTVILSDKIGADCVG